MHTEYYNMGHNDLSWTIGSELPTIADESWFWSTMTAPCIATVAKFRDLWRWALLGGVCASSPPWPMEEGSAAKMAAHLDTWDIPWDILKPQTLEFHVTQKLHNVLHKFHYFHIGGSRENLY